MRSETSNAPEASGSESLLLALCRVGDWRYAIPTSAIQRILRMPELTPAPDASGDVAGLLSIQGVIWSVVDPRPRLGIKTPHAHPDQRVVLVSAANRYALWMDDVEGIESVPWVQVEWTADDKHQSVSTAIAHIDGAIVPILSLDAFDPGPTFVDARQPAHD